MGISCDYDSVCTTIDTEIHTRVSLDVFFQPKGRTVRDRIGDLLNGVEDRSEVTVSICAAFGRLQGRTAPRPQRQSASVGTTRLVRAFGENGALAQST
jgi:hypothetical protein